MCSLINKQLLLTAYAYLFIMEQQKAQRGSEALQLQVEKSRAKKGGRQKIEVEDIDLVVARPTTQSKSTEEETYAQKLGTKVNVNFCGGRAKESGVGEFLSADSAKTVLKKFAYFTGDSEENVSFKPMMNDDPKFWKDDTLDFFVAKYQLTPQGDSFTAKICRKIMPLGRVKHTEVWVGRKVRPSETGGSKTGQYMFEAFSFESVGGGTVQRVTDNLGSADLESVIKITKEPLLSAKALLFLCGKTGFECADGPYSAFGLRKRDIVKLAKKWKPKGSVEYYGVPCGQAQFNCHGYAYAMHHLTNGDDEGNSRAVLEKPWKSWWIYSVKVPPLGVLDMQRTNGENAKEEHIQWWSEEEYWRFYPTLNTSQSVSDNDEK